jgi:ankyrin repeat protein
MRFHLKSVAWIACLAAVASSLCPAAPSDLRLIQAVKSQNVESVRGLLKQHVDVNAAQGDRSTALHWAADLDNLTIADLLIRAGARANAANDLGATPLYLACRNRSVSMVDRLLAAGADANAKLLNGETALMTCASTGEPKTVKALLVHGADAKAREPEHDQTALMWAAAQSHPEAVAMLIEFGADVRARSRIYSQTVVGEQTQRAGREELNYIVQRGGMTPLLFAARNGDAATAKLLLAAGADPNDALPDGTSAVVLAAHSGQGNVAFTLLEKGADPNAMGSGYTALHAAALRSDLNLVKALLTHGADPNIRMTKGTPVRRDTTDFNLLAPLIGSTPYLLAAKFLEPEIMQALVAGGADPKMTMPNGATPLMLAVGMGSSFEESRRGINVIDFGKVEPESQVLEAVKTAFNLSGDVNAVNRAGVTALHAAAAWGHDTVVQFLADHGAQLNAKNKSGLTPLAALSAPVKRKYQLATTASGGDSAGEDPAQAARLRTAALLRKLGATD